MIRYFVGSPGSGKTTMAVKLMKKEIKPKRFKKLKFNYDYIFQILKMIYQTSLILTFLLLLSFQNTLIF